jgi:hypothetical protein
MPREEETARGRWKQREGGGSSEMEVEAARGRRKQRKEETLGTLFYGGSLYIRRSSSANSLFKYHHSHLVLCSPYAQTPTPQPPPRQHHPHNHHSNSATTTTKSKVSQTRVSHKTMKLMLRAVNIMEHAQTSTKKQRKEAHRCVQFLPSPHSGCGSGVEELLACARAEGPWYPPTNRATCCKRWFGLCGGRYLGSSTYYCRQLVCAWICLLLDMLTDISRRTEHT